MKIFFTKLSVIVFDCSFLLNFAQPVSALQSYYIEGVVDSNTIVVSRGTSTYKIDVSYGCSFSSFSDVGKSILIDSDFMPSYGDSVIESDFSNSTCEVTYSKVLYLSTYTIESVEDSTTLILSKGSSFYKTDFHYGCSFSSSDRGKTVDIDSLFSPSYDSVAIVAGLFSSETCTVSSSSSLNLTKYSITDHLSGSKIIIKNDYGSKYLLQYGIGCLSLSYTIDSIYIDGILPGFLSTIYHFEDNESCSVVDSDSISSGLYVPIPISNLSPVASQTVDAVKQPTLAEREKILNNNVKVDLKFTEKMKGNLLLQVQDGGKIWYVSPKDGKRYEVTQANVMSVFRKLSFGITNDNLKKIPTEKQKSVNNAFVANSRGKLQLQVQDRGRIWYVNPKDGKRREVTQANALSLFRKLSIGVTNSNLNKIRAGLSE